MKRVYGAYGVAALLAVLGVVMLVTLFINNNGVWRAIGLEGFQSRSIDCKGVTCEEGQFCQDNVCKAISPPYTNNYFPSSTS